MAGLAPRLVVAVAVTAAAAVAGCGGAAGPARPVRHVRTCAPMVHDLTAPGRFAVAEHTAALERPAAPGAPAQAIDPTVWFPATAPAHCRFPVVLFSHGVDSDAGQYGRLLAHLASYGFVVIGPHHRDTGPAQDTRRVADLRYVLDHLRRVAGRLVPGLGRRIDPGSVGAAGHSFGAHTVAALAAEDPRRLKAIMVMAGGADPTEAARIQTPTLAVTGAEDQLIPPADVRAFAASLPATTPHALMEIAGAGHGAYADTCTQSATCAIVGRAATALFLTYLDGRRDTVGPLDPHRQGERRVQLTAVGMPPR
jgi:predicted dienelactone hydrolase